MRIFDIKELQKDGCFQKLFVSQIEIGIGLFESKLSKPTLNPKQDNPTKILCFSFRALSEVRVLYTQLVHLVRVEAQP